MNVYRQSIGKKKIFVGITIKDFGFIAWLFLKIKDTIFKAIKVQVKVKDIQLC